jgi:hypothetical protein
MPTLEELKAQMVAAGITDPSEINRRIAQEMQAGTLEAEAPTRPTAEVVAEYEQEQGATPTAEKYGGTIQRLRAQGASEEEIRRLLHAPGVRQAAATYLGGEEVAPKVPEYPESYLEAQAAEGGKMPLPAGEFVPPAIAPPTTQPGLEMPTMQMPGLGGLRGALGEQEAAYKQATKKLTGATEEYQRAITKKAEAESAGIQAEAGVREEQRIAYEKEHADMVIRQQERQAHVDAEMSKVRDAVDEMKASKIDPYRFYRHPDGSTNYPKSIAAAIAVGLGALGSNLPAQYGGTGGPNMALQIIDKAIDRDIAAQRDDIANQRAGVGIQMNLLSKMQNIYSSRDMQEAGARVVMLETYKMKLLETAAKSGSAKVEANAQVLIAQADQAEATVLSDMRIKAAASKVAGEEKLYTARARGAQAKYKQQVAQMKAEQVSAAPVAFPGARIKAGAYVPNEDDYRKSKPMVAAYNDAAEKLDDLIAWREEFGQEKLAVKEVKNANKKLLRLRSAMRIIDETGARLDPGEIEMMGLDFKMGDLGFVKSYLQTIKQSIRTKVSAAIGVRGFELADQPSAGARKREQ